MPPVLALSLCTAYVLFLLRLERQQSRGVSVFTWIPTIWFMSVSSKPLGIWFGQTGSNEAGSPLDRMLLVALAGAGLGVMTSRRFQWSVLLRGNMWLLGLLGYMLLSTFWSDITMIALRRWSREAIVVIMVLVVLSESDPGLALESVLRRSAFILIPYSLLLTKYYTDLGVIYSTWEGKRMWVGVADHKNSLGCLCVVVAFFLVWALYRRWRGHLPVVRSLEGAAELSVLAIAVFLLKGEENAYSATSLATMGVGCVSLAVLFRLRRRGVVVARAVVLTAVLTLAAFGVSAPFLGGSNVAVFSASLGRDETLTGRTETWAELVPVVMERPLLGVGFGSFWTTERREFYQMSHGHNGYLDVLLQLGGVGLGVYVIWLLSCARRLHASLSANYDWAAFGICLLFMTLAYNTTESALSSLASVMTGVLVLVASVVPSETNARLVKSPVRDALRAPLAPQIAPGRVARAGGWESRRGVRSITDA